MEAEHSQAWSSKRMKPQVKSIFISSNEFAAEFDSYGYPVFKDVRQDYPGPLAGIETILKQDLGGPWYFVSPTDTPFLPRNLAGLLHKTAKEKQALCVFQLTKVKRNLCTACFIKTSCPR